VVLLLLVSFQANSQAEEGFFEAKGVRLRYLDEGQGQAVVLLHGLGRSAETWGAISPEGSGLMPMLSKQYRVLALDARGQGKSDKPHDPKLYGTETVEDVVRLLDHLKIKKAHIIGYSVGGGIAAKLLVTHPDRLLSVTLVSRHIIFERSKKQQEKGRAFLNYLEHEDQRVPFIMASIPPGQPKPTMEQAQEIVKQEMMGQDIQATAAYMRGYFGTLQVTRKQLRANKVSVLVTYGSLESIAEADKQLSEAADKQLSDIAQLVRGQLIVIKDADHGSIITMPSFLDAVQTFLRLNNP